MFDLNNMTSRQVFDAGVVHMQTQGHQSLQPGTSHHCLYRGPNGDRCVVGYFIPDDIYNPKMENWSIDTLINMKGFKTKFKKLGFVKHYHTLVNLQNIHDSKNSWNKDGLKQTVIDHFLKYYV